MEAIIDGWKGAPARKRRRRRMMYLGMVMLA
jgi:hypothetical protein